MAPKKKLEDLDEFWIGLVMSMNNISKNIYKDWYN